MTFIENILKIFKKTHKEKNFRHTNITMRDKKDSILSAFDLISSHTQFEKIGFTNTSC